MFMSLLKERAQQLYNSAEKLTAVMDLERLKYKILKTQQQETQRQQMLGSSQLATASTHCSESEFVVLDGFTHVNL